LLIPSVRCGENGSSLYHSNFIQSTLLCCVNGAFPDSVQYQYSRLMESPTLPVCAVILHLTQETLPCSMLQPSTGGSLHSKKYWKVDGKKLVYFPGILQTVSINLRSGFSHLLLNLLLHHLQNSLGEALQFFYQLREIPSTYITH
jgi:hypothetical protein